jgi:hypothetical protein
VRLSGVLDDAQVASTRDLVDGVHVRGLTVKMHRQNGARARGDGILNLLRVEVVRRYERLNRQWARPGVGGRQPGGNVGVGWHDNLLALANPVGAQNDMQGFEAVANANAVFDAAIAREFLLEGFHFPAENIPARFHHAEVGRVQFGA